MICIQHTVERLVNRAPAYMGLVEATSPVDPKGTTNKDGTEEMAEGPTSKCAQTKLFKPKHCAATARKSKGDWVGFNAQTIGAISDEYRDIADDNGHEGQHIFFQLVTSSRKTVRCTTLHAND